MRKIEGYICLAKFEGHFPFTKFIGQNTGNGNASWESFNSNGMIPFVTLPEAARAQQELLAKSSFDLVEVTKGRIRWEMAENETDLANFTKRRLRSFIVVSLGDIYEFYGPWMEGLPAAYPIPGAHLSDNGLIAHSGLLAKLSAKVGYQPASPTINYAGLNNNLLTSSLDPILLEYQLGLLSSVVEQRFCKPSTTVRFC